MVFKNTIGQYNMWNILWAWESSMISYLEVDVVVSIACLFLL